MWLINTDTLKLVYFHQADGIEYAILSHTWGEEEITFQDMQLQSDCIKSRESYNKVVQCCRQAVKDGLPFAWVDTCCIDKSSSAELSEAINSMFSWYQKAAVCYAYLADVCPFELHYNHEMCVSRLKGSRWFTRGWTLQELLAPAQVCFFAQDWTCIGTKLHLHQAIQQITGISRRALLGQPMSSFTVAERMSWAANRKTARIEDIAYSLLGIFGIHMPLLYGEGPEAFRRLQEQIIENILDYTIFAWVVDTYGTGDPMSLLAKDPSAFYRAGRDSWPPWLHSDLMLGPSNVEFIEQTREPPAVTSQGIRLHRPTSELQNGAVIVCLCWLRDRPDDVLCLELRQAYLSRNIFYRFGNAVRVKSSADLRSMPLSLLYGVRKDPTESKDEPSNQAVHLLNLVVNDMLTQTGSTVSLREFAIGLKHDRSWCKNCGYHGPRESMGYCPTWTVSAESPSFQKHVEEHELRCSQHLPPALQRGEAEELRYANMTSGYYEQAFRLQWHLHNLQIRSHIDWVPLRTLYLCCLSTLIQERRARRLSERWQLRFLTGLVDATRSACPVGIVLLRLYDLWEGGGFTRNVDDAALLFACILQCCNLLSDRNDLDHFTILILESRLRFFHGYRLRELAPDIYSEPSIAISQMVTALADDDLILTHFITRLSDQPDPADTHSFTTWFLSLFTAWRAYAEPTHLIGLFQTISMSIEGFSRARGGETNSTIVNASRVVRGLNYCARRLDVMRKPDPFPLYRMYGQTDWQEIARLVDLAISREASEMTSTAKIAGHQSGIM